MWGFWIIVILLVVFFVWAGYRVRGRSSGSDAQTDRHRRTDGYSPGA